MPPKTCLKSGSVRLKMVAMTALLFVVLGLAYLLFRSSPVTPTVKQPTGPREVARTNLVLTEGRWVEVGRTSAFNGLVVEHYPDGVLRSRSAVNNGHLHGLSEGFYTNAVRQVTEYFKDGVSDGLRTKWYANGAKQSEANIVDGKLHGAFRKWHENGTLSEQVEFKAGEPEGVSLAYFPSGYLKARVVLKDGKPIEQTFWKDGEKKE